MSEHYILHAVWGISGQSPSWEEWLVAAYVDRAKAEEHVRLVTAWRKEQFERIQADDYQRADSIRTEACPFDHAAPWQILTLPSYSIVLVKVHHDPMQFTACEAVLDDFARERGWL